MESLRIFNFRVFPTPAFGAEKGFPPSARKRVPAFGAEKGFPPSARKKDSRLRRGKAFAVGLLFQGNSPILDFNHRCCF